MSCLYVATAMHDYRGVLKFGISRYDNPGPRLWQHEHSRDNPFGARIRELTLHESFGFQHLMEARNCETAICSRTKQFERLPRFASLPSHRLYIPVDERPECSPSGEWMLYTPQHEEEIVIVFLRHAIEGLRRFSKLYKVCGLAADVFERVHEQRLAEPAS